MAYIDNSETKKEINDAIRGNAVSNLAPTKINDSVQPVININPKDYRRVNLVKSSNKTTTGTLTVFTSDATKDTFLTAVALSFTKNAACDIATSSIAVTCTQDGANVNLLRTEVQTLTAERGDLILPLYPPIKIDRNTTVTCNGTFAAGVLSRGVSVVGYIVEP